MERADDRRGDSRSSCASMEDCCCVSRDVSRNLLVALLELGRLARDVVDSVQTRRSDFSGYSAALFAVGGPDRELFC